MNVFRRPGKDVMISEDQFPYDPIGGYGQYDASDANYPDTLARTACRTGGPRLAAAAGLVPVLIHGDIHEHQLLADGGEITGILDWETARVDHPFWDFDLGEWSAGLWRRHRRDFSGPWATAWRWLCSTTRATRQWWARSRSISPGSASVPVDEYAFIMHNECMPLIQIRDVPESVRDELARKAAAAGQSMQAYLLNELSKLAERPSMAEIIERAQARAKATGSTVTMDDAVAAVRAARDRRQEP